MTVTELAPAKINLALHVTGQRDDGYHLLDSLVAFTQMGDVLAFDHADAFSLDIDGSYGASLSNGAGNLVLKAAAALHEALGLSSKQAAKIKLTKNLPVASGIGGGSADAAATLRGLLKLWDVSLPPVQLEELALTLGADVPMCLQSRAAQVSGIGENIKPVPLPELHMVLVNPNIGVSTPKVFFELATKQNNPLSDLSNSNISTRQDFAKWLSAQRNDLQAPAIKLVPQIQNCIDALREAGSEFARMSGSGATCFGLFSDTSSAKEAARHIVEHHAAWWVAATRTVS